MKLRIISDLHIEFWKGNHANKAKLLRTIENALPLMDEDSESKLIVAGDFTNFDHLESLDILMEYLSERFHSVFYIPGNHESYYGPWQGTNVLIGRICHKYPNVRFGETLASENIIGTTLWTDFSNGNPVTMNAARSGMNDYDKIKQDEFFIRGEFYCPAITPEMVLYKHQEMLRYLSDRMDEDSVVVTHHAPSERSIHPGYRDSTLNPCYYSNLEYLIEEKKPRLWIHGHVHTPFDYMIGETRVICNPHGYAAYENTGYNRKLIVEV